MSSSPQAAITEWPDTPPNSEARRDQRDDASGRGPGHGASARSASWCTHVPWCGSPRWQARALAYSAASMHSLYMALACAAPARSRQAAIASLSPSLGVRGPVFRPRLIGRSSPWPETRRVAAATSAPNEHGDPATGGVARAGWSGPRAWAGSCHPRYCAAMSKAEVDGIVSCRLYASIWCMTRFRSHRTGAFDGLCIRRPLPSSRTRPCSQQLAWFLLVDGNAMTDGALK